MLSLLLMASLAVQEPVRVNARLTQNDIAAGETTILRVEVETDGPRAQIGRFRQLPPGVELVSTRDFDQRQFSIPGGTRRFITREFILRPRAAGQYRLPQLDVVVDGQAYSTPSLLLTVTSAAGGARGEESGPPGQVVLRAWLSEDTAYVGQQVTMNAEAMFSQTARLRLRRSPEYEPPSPSGFWVQELPAGRGTGTRMVDGEIYEVQGFRRAFFPLSPGEYEIPPARLEYEMRRGILYAPETFVLESDPMRLVVLAPPGEGRPEGFTGAVGIYAVRGWLEPSRVPAGEAAVLTVEVTGRGNIRAVPPPELPPLDQAEVFPPSEEAESEVVDGHVRGTKRFTWVLIPQRSGELEIPEIRYPYFDPQARQYQVTSVSPLTLDVGPGGATVAEAPTGTLRYLKTTPAPSRLEWVRTPWFAAAQGVPLLALLLAVAVRRRRAAGVSRRELRRRRRAGIRELEERVTAADPAFFADLEGFVRRWLADRLGIDPRHASQRTALTAAGAGEGTAGAVVTLIERLAAARYAPEPPPPSARRELVRGAESLLERVDREAPPPGTGEKGRGRAALFVLAAVLLGSAAGPSPVQADQLEGHFPAGLEAFDQERYAAAADAFQRHVRSSPDDAAGWYNLGTALYRDGQRGPAIWAWLHVPPLDPRDDDTRHNLRVAGATPELVSRVAPTVPLRAAELALLGSLAWFVAGGAGAWWIARRRRLAGVVAMLGLAAAVALGAAWLDSTRDRETLIVLNASTLRAGPTLRGEALGELEAGSGLVPVSEYNEWLRVRTLEGREGWIENRSVGAL